MRFLHTMLRVGNLEKSIAFYTNVLGMQLLRQKEYPDGHLPWHFLVMVMNQKIPHLN